MDVIDRYELLEELGAGGFGRVYRARHQVLGREVALKVLLDRSERDRFLREAAILAQLDHPHIVKVFDSGTTPDGHAFLALELLEGETTAQRLRATGAQPVAEATWMVDQLLDGLAAAHERGIVHRDLKHPNVFLAQGADGVTLKILDFGIARLPGAGRLTSTGVLMGTPRYMAPEVLGGGEADTKADLWAAALMLYELLLGQPAYVGTPEEAMKAIVQGPPPPLRSRAPDLPPLLYDVIDTALAHDPSARFATASAFRSALRAASTARPVRRTTQRKFATGMLGPASLSDPMEGIATTAPELAAPRPTASTKRAKPQSPLPAASGATRGSAAPEPAAPERRRSGRLVAGLLIAVAVLLVVSIGALYALFSGRAAAGVEAARPEPVPEPVPTEPAVAEEVEKPPPEPHTLPEGWAEPTAETEASAADEPPAPEPRHARMEPRARAAPRAEPSTEWGAQPEGSAGGRLVGVRSCTALDGGFTAPQVRRVQRQIGARGIRCPPDEWKHTIVIRYENGRSQDVGDGEGWSVYRCLRDGVLSATTNRFGSTDGRIRCELQ